MNYMFKSKLLLILLALLVLTGCGYKQTNTQSRDVSYLKFTKSISKNYIVVVNDKYEFKLDSCIEKDANEECVNSTFNKMYEISSGNSFIKVFDGQNNLIMRKEIYVGSSNTMEINLP